MTARHKNNLRLIKVLKKNNIVTVIITLKGDKSVTQISNLLQQANNQATSKT